MRINFNANMQSNKVKASPSHGKNSTSKVESSSSLREQSGISDRVKLGELEPGDERYIKFLRSQYTTEFSPRKVSLLYKSLPILTPLSMGLIGTAIGASWGAMGALIFGMSATWLGTIGIPAARNVARHLMDPISPVEAVKRLKQGKPVYVNGNKIESLKDLEVYMNSLKSKK